MKQPFRGASVGRVAGNGNGHKLHSMEPSVVPTVVQADTGLGTTFERWALYRLLNHLQAEFKFQSLLEAPGDGMTGIAGINSLGLGIRGLEVSLLLPDPEQARFTRKVWDYYAPQAQVNIYDHWNGSRLPFGTGQYDLVWNFNVMIRQPDPLALIAEMRRVSRKYVMVCVPNRYNYGFWLHRLHHHLAKELWEHGEILLMDPSPWLAMFQVIGLKVKGAWWVDCPWWPDIVDPAQLIRDFFPFLKRFTEHAGPGNRRYWHYTDLPYFHPMAYPAVHRQMAQLAYIETTAHKWLKRRFAHHVCVLGAKE